ncbi:SMC family ATPase [Campylobacter ureolyticus]|uniref:AAA family ATPase n=1 Tax=Campylobacter ureolyticus TaxID=827 RepID=UPI0022B5BA37|nr:SMC family ATPase [Campylobacter ureolyticus]MCZ6155520.1 SMC family ATPase [Campylobacter ureolyticus]
MKLTKLTLKNFKKYAYEEFDFSDGITGIVGKNGSGKSTIFDAISFALFGYLKNKKELVKNSNADENESVEVKLDFLIGSDAYIVIRTYTGKNLISKDSIYKNDNPIASDTSSVNEEILNLIKMNRKIFENTVFARQKDLITLSEGSTQDRKKMMRKLLGLEKLDTITENLQKEIKDLSSQIGIISVLSDDEKTKMSENIKKHKDENDAINKEIEELCKEKNKLKNRYIEINKELLELKDIKNSEDKINTYKNQIQNYEKELKDLKNKQNSLQNLKQYNDDYNELEQKIKQLNELKSKNSIKNEKEKNFNNQKNNLDSQQKNLKLKKEEIKKIIKNYKILNKNYDNNEEKLKDLSEKIKGIDKDINTAEERINVAKEAIQKAETQKDNIQKIGKNASCPTCSRPLQDEYDGVISSLTKTINDLSQNKISDERKNIEKYQSELKSVEEEKNNIEKEIKDHDAKKNELEKGLLNYNKDKENIIKIKNEIKTLNEELEVFKNINYDENYHNKVIENQKKLEPKKDEYITTLEVIKGIPKVEGVIKDLNSKISEENNKLLGIQENNSSLKYDEKEFNNKNLEKEELEEKIKELDKKTDDKNKDLNNNTKILSQIEADEKNNIKNEEKKEELINKKDINDKIKNFLEKFKTYINSTISPRISTIASDMFSKITNKKYDLIEIDNDFDFFIYDEGKKYDIKRFSGGEIDLANLVIRIAISEVAAELNGINTTEFLAFDEIFGSQDEERREGILNAFNAIKEKYSQVFLISHEQDIKDAFENIIEL